MRTISTKKLTITALLIAMGIIIPLVMPRIVIGPASFTLASHVPLMIAMFFSPNIAIAVALGTAVGFLLTSPFIIALRALSHVIFAWVGAMYLQKHPELTLDQKKFQFFNVWIALLHTIVEVLVVAIFFLFGNTAGTSYDGSLFVFLVVFMGLGGFVHSLVDYNIAYFISKPLSRAFDVPVFTKVRLLKK